MIRKLKLLVCVVLGALTLSCSDWLKVSSEDRIMENDLFRTPRGFMTALNDEAVVRRLSHGCLQQSYMGVEEYTEQLMKIYEECR